MVETKHLPSYLSNAIETYVELGDTTAFEINDILKVAMKEWLDAGCDFFDMDTAKQDECMDVITEIVTSICHRCFIDNHDTLEVLRDMRGIIQQHGSIDTLQKALEQPKAPANQSPHAPVPKARPDYWLKAVTSIDPNTPNAYGIKGKLITASDTTTLPTGQYIVGRDRRSGIYFLYQAKDNCSCSGIKSMPGLSEVTMIASFDKGYELYDCLDKARGVAKTNAS